MTILIGDVQRSRGGYARASAAEQAANFIPDLGWPLGVPPASGPGAYPIHLLDNFWGLTRHPAVDIPARAGTPIRATVSGEVIRNRRGDEEGNYLAIEDARGRRHYFLHMRYPAPAELRPRTSSSPGTRVQKGQVIGVVGSTGRSDGPHLHYAIVLPNNHVIDPFPMLVAARQRENPPGVVGALVVGQTAEEWRTLEILVERLMARVTGWRWPQSAIDRAPDPSSMRTQMRTLREGKQQQMRTLAEAFRLRRARHEFADAQRIVQQMQQTWGDFEAFAAQFAADANATFTENVTRGVDQTVTNVVDAGVRAATSVGAGLFVVALVGVGIFAGVSAAARAHGARA